MSFLFKSSKKGGPVTPNALPPATRDIRSSDGQQLPQQSQSIASQSQTPPPLAPLPQQQQAASPPPPPTNGTLAMGIPKPASPTPSMTVTNSLNALQANDKIAMRPSPLEEVPSFAMQMQEPGRGSGPPSPEQKSIREKSLDSVSLLN